MHFAGLLRFVLAMLAACAFAGAALAAEDEARTLAARAKALVEAKDPGGAFRVLEPHEERLGGDVEFDYWLGVAAFESNRLDRAVIAFERVLVRDPLFDSAQIGRAHV